MINRSLFFGLIAFNLILAQENNSSNQIIKWGNYFMINQNYKKAIAKYLNFNGKMNNEIRRNLAFSYSKIGKLKEAEKILRPIVDSDSAQVIDYYEFASYLTNNDKLRDEYRQKALRLPIFQSKLKTNNTNNNSYILINLNNNTINSEFSSFLMERENEKKLIFSKIQSKKFDKNLKKGIKSEYPIYNLYDGTFNESKFMIENEKLLPVGINTAFQDGPASWDEITDKLYFTRSSDLVKKNELIQLDLYEINYSKIKLEEPRSVTINVKGFSTMHPSVSGEKRRLYFSSDRPGGYGGMDIYYSHINSDGSLGKPINLGPDINSSKDQIFPFAMGEKFLFFSEKAALENIKLKLGINIVDIRWNVSDLPKPFNNSYDNFSFSFNKDLDYGFFSSNRKNGKGDDDLYVFKFTPKIEGIDDQYKYNPVDTLIVSNNGVLVNDEAQLFANDPLTSLIQKEVELKSSPKFGILKLRSNGSFLYKNTYPIKELDSFSYVILTKFGKSDPIQVFLKRSLVSKNTLPENLKKTFLPIYYNYNESNLLINYKDRVDAVVRAIIDNPKMIIEISSFSDCRGEREYNLKLSEKRNQTIINYVNNLVGNSTRVFGKGYGEDKVLNNDTKDYLIVGGTFNSIESAKKVNQEFITIGIKSRIRKNDLGSYQIIIDDGDSAIKTRSLSKKLKKQGIDNWISPCDCCNLTEDQHKLNRKTEFKIIRY